MRWIADCSSESQYRTKLKKWGRRKPRKSQKMIANAEESLFYSAPALHMSSTTEQLPEQIHDHSYLS